jgi:hypothetical protein
MKKRGIDPILEEVDEMRRRIMAEHGNDWQKVLDHYVEVGKKHQGRDDRTEPAEQGQSVA